MTEPNEHEIVARSGRQEVKLNVDLPSNTNKKRVTVKDLRSAQKPVESKEEEAPKEAEERPRLEKVVENAARQKKRGFGRWLKDTFTGEDAKSVARHVGMDVVIPAIKDMIADAGTQALQRMLFGDSSPRRGGGDPRDRQHVPYSRISSQPRQRARELPARSRATHDFEDIILDRRTEAEDVLAALTRRVEDYGSASVADLYDLVDISGDFTDDKWGWYDLRNSGIRRIRTGYILILPRPEVIE